LFFPWSVLPAWLVAPAVVTVHDVCFRTHPERFADAGRSGDAVLAAAVRTATEVLTPSAASRCGVVAAYGLDDDRVTVVRHGIAPIFTPEPSPSDADSLRKLGVGPPYFLCVSTHEPRKNLAALVEAFVRYVERCGSASLVLVGRRSAETARMVEVLSSSLPATERTHFVDGVSDAELAALYRQASAVALPSVCEGFGFPLLESIACGTPVLASDLPVFRELVGDAAEYVPWHDVDAWVTALERASADTSLALAARSAAARIRSEFSWRTCATATFHAFERAARRPRKLHWYQPA
jgi:glycosyltransferase involved in cell wall biosynthesis